MLLKLKTDFFDRFDVKMTTYYTLALMVFALTISAFFYYRLQHNLLKQIDRLLHDETNELLLEIREEGGIVAGCEGFSEDAVYRKFYPIVFRVLDKTGRTAWQSKNTPDGLFPPVTHNDFFTCVGADGKKHFRLHEISITERNNPDTFILQLGTDNTNSRKILENSVENILGILPVVFIASILVGMLISQKPRKILRHTIDLTNRITSQNLAERLDLPSGRDEIRELTKTINSMLDRIENAFQEIRQFTSDASHELRNPLSAIKGEIEVTLNRKRNAPEYIESLYNCLEKTNDLIKMVNDLFLISRYDTGKYDLELETFNFSELVKGMYEFFLPMAQDKKISFTMTHSKEIFITADKTKILRLINNLIDNALKFTPENGSIAITVEKTEKEIRLSISDSGIGIPETEIDKIFNRFYQVDEARSEKNPGFGLGLHICKKIMEAHGGAINVKPNPTRGVTFTVTLPGLK